MQLGYQQSHHCPCYVSVAGEDEFLQESTGQCKKLAWPLSPLGVPCLTDQGFGDCSQKAVVFPAPANRSLLQGKSQWGLGGGEFLPVLSVIVIDLKLLECFWMQAGSFILISWCVFCQIQVNKLCPKCAEYITRYPSFSLTPLQHLPLPSSSYTRRTFCPSLFPELLQTSLQKLAPP